MAIMHVDVDAAGKHILAAGVERFAALADIAADRGDLAVLDGEVGFKDSVARNHQPAVRDHGV